MRPSIGVAIEFLEMDKLIDRPGVDGFEPSVPLANEPRFRLLITRKSLTTPPPHFRLGSIPYAPKESREQQRQRFSPDPSP